MPWAESVSHGQRMADEMTTVKARINLAARADRSSWANVLGNNAPSDSKSALSSLSDSSVQAD